MRRAWLIACVWALANSAAAVVILPALAHG